MRKPRLTIELIPGALSGINLRSRLSKKDWDRVRRKCYRLADYRCEACGGRGKKHPVECHEVWQYRRRVQKLVGLKALCPRCHEATHFGRATLMGHRKRAFDHLKKVNRWSKKRTEKYLEEQRKAHHKRAQVENWKQDISYIERYLDD